MSHPYFDICCWFVAPIYGKMWGLLLLYSHYSLQQYYEAIMHLRGPIDMVRRCDY